MENKQKRYFTLALLLGIFALASVSTLQGSLLTGVIEHYQLTDAIRGYPSGAVSIGAIVSLIIALILGARVSKPKLLMLSLTLMSVMPMGLFLLPSFPVFVAICLLLGVFIGLADTLLSACMAQLYPSGRLGTRMMCALHTVYGLSGMLSPLVYAQILSSGRDFHLVYPVVTVFGLICVLVSAPAAARQARTEKASPLEARTDGLARGSLATVLGSRNIRFLMIAMFCYGFHLNGGITWINRYVSHLQPGVLADRALSFMFLGIMVSRILMPFLRIRPIVYVRAAGLIACALLAIGMITQSAVGMCVFLCLAAVVSGGMIPYMLNIGCEGEEQNTMLVTTVLLLSLYIGQAVCPPLIGALEKHIGLGGGMLLCFLFAALSSVSALFAKPSVIN